jgi:hypothetical protein
VLKSRDFSEINISEKFTKITKSFGFGLGVGHAQETFRDIIIT